MGELVGVVIMEDVFFHFIVKLFLVPISEGARLMVQMEAWFAMAQIGAVFSYSYRRASMGES